MSPGEGKLRGLLRLCAEHDERERGAPEQASSEQLALRERLRGKVLDAFVAARPAIRLALHGPLTSFLMFGGNASWAARVHGRTTEAQQRAVRRAADELLEFAVEYLARGERARAQRARGYRAAQLQCMQTCGRDSQGATPGQGGRQGCPTCPMRAFEG